MSAYRQPCQAKSSLHKRQLALKEGRHIALKITDLPPGITLADIFGRKSDAKKAALLMRNNPDMYRDLREIAHARPSLWSHSSPGR